MGGEATLPATTLELSATQGVAWTIGVALSDGTGAPVTRELTGDDCETLTDAVALIVAVHVDAVGVVRTRPSLAAPTVVAPAPPEPIQPAVVAEPHVEPPPEPAPARVVAATPSTEEPPRRDRIAKPRVAMSASVAGEVGLLPRGAASLEIASGLWWPHVRLHLVGLASLGPDARATTTLPSAGFGLFGGVVRGCGAIAKGRLEVPLCGGVEVADLRARPAGRGTKHTLWVALTPSVRPTWVILPRLAVFGLVDVPVALRRHRYLIDGEDLHTVAPIGARFGVGVQVRLP